MKDLARLEPNRETARALFAQLSEGMEALAAARQGKQTRELKVATHSSDYSATNDDSTTPT